VRSGYAFKSKDWTDGGIPVVRIGNVKDGELAMDKCSFVPEGVANEASEYRLEAGDILIAMTGYIGDVAWVRDNEPRMLNQRVGRFTIDEPTKLDPRYLFYVLRSPDIRAAIEALGYGSAQPNVSPRLLHSVRIPLPSLAEQQAIACILGALDDKIELNRKMNQTLEGLARAIFKSWFVDFDPVRAKAEERDSGLPTEITDLFPSSFVDSELGEIPEGWTAAPLSEYVNLIRGRSYKSEELAESDTAMVTLKSFARGGGYRKEGLKAYTGQFKPEQQLYPGELVVSCTDVTQAAEVIGRPAIVESTSTFSKLVASLDVQIVRPLSPSASVPFLYCLFRTERSKEHTYAHSTGTTVLHLAKDALPSFLFVLPNARVGESFSSIVRPLFSRMDVAQMESDSLGKVRDTLLPKLISGELRVPDAEKIVGRCA
jgi:type I restriction enzyme S subunit